MALRTGTIVGNWKVTARIKATGGMGLMYQVEHTTLGDTGVLKIPNEQLCEDPKLKERFLAEARNARKVRHARVVSVLDAGTFKDPDDGDEIPYLVMELLQGEDLARVMASRGRLSPSEVAALFEDLGGGLQAAHASGVFHLDLKPENLFMVKGDDGHARVKVVDFGISKALSGGGRSTTLTTKFASPQWAAPEQILATRVSAATDVWSLGLVAFYLLTGRFYWRAANVGAATGQDPGAMLLMEIQNSTGMVLSDGAEGLRLDPGRVSLPPASVRAKEVKGEENLPPGFDDWLARCLKVNPTERWPSVAECVATLSRVLRGVEEPRPAVASTSPLGGVPGVPSHAPTEPMVKPGVGMPPIEPRVPTRAEETPRARVSVGVMVALGAVLVAGVLAVAFRGPRGDSDAGVRGDSGVVVAAVDVPPRVPHCPDGSVLIRAGSFTMGTEPDGGGESDERPAHRVTLPAFCMDRTEVTVAQFARCVEANACRAETTVNWSGYNQTDVRIWSRFCTWGKTDQQNHPINCVDWHQARAYCGWSGGRLPREAEWEYAARGDEGRIYPWGSDPPSEHLLNAAGGESRRYMEGLGRRPWYTMYNGDDRWPTTASVGSFPAGVSPFGLLDMAGNVWEWVEDVYAADAYQRHDAEGFFAREATDASQSTELRVSRGGCWVNYSPAWVRAADRGWDGPGHRGHYLGFRCARGVTC